MDISSSYNDYYAQLAGAQDAKQLSGKLGNTNAASSDDELMEACKQFESYLLEQVFKNMEATTKVFSEKDEDANSQLVDFYTDQTIQKIAGQATEQNSVGLAKLLYDQMKINLNAVTAADIAKLAADAKAEAAGSENVEPEKDN